MFVFRRATEAASSAREQQIYADTARTAAYFFAFLLAARVVPLIINRVTRRS